jgi:hypothetical protein
MTTQPLTPEVRDMLTPEQDKRLRVALDRQRNLHAEERVAHYGFVGNRRVSGDSAAHELGCQGVNRLASLAISLSPNVWDDATGALFLPLGYFVWWAPLDEVFIEPIRHAGLSFQPFGSGGMTSGRHPLTFEVDREVLSKIGPRGWPLESMQIQFSYMFAPLCGRGGCLHLTPKGIAEREDFWVS